MGNRIIKHIVFVFALLAVSYAFADSLPESQDMGLPFTGKAPSASIAIIIKEAMKYIGVLAIISLSWGGVQFLISAGEEQKVKAGKSIIIYSIVGVLLSITAYTIVDILIAFKIA